jgi:GxxExxY protein
MTTCFWDNVLLDVGYRLDLIVDDRVILELKCVERITDVHLAQLLSYLKLSGMHVGLLLNFHVKQLKDGTKRIVNGDPTALCFPSGLCVLCG